MARSTAPRFVSEVSQVFVALQELEEDPEMRAKMALYRDPAYDPVAEAERRAAAMTDDEEGDVPEVPLEELLDDLAGLQLEQDEQPGAQQHTGNMQQPGT